MQPAASCLGRRHGMGVEGRKPRLPAIAGGRLEAQALGESYNGSRCTQLLSLKQLRPALFRQ